MINPLDIIRKYYTLDSLAGQSLLIHSQLVRDKAQSLAIRHPEMDLDIPFIQEAAMLHDIGIFLTKAPDIGCFGEHPYKYYSTQRPIDIGTYPNSYFNRPVHMDLYFTRQQVMGEAFQAWGAIIYAHPLTEREMQNYELRPSRENLDIRRQMDAQAQVVGKWEDAHHVPDQKRLTWFYPDFGSYVVKEYITPEQLAVRVRSIERQEAARAHKEAKHQPPIAEQLKAAQREAQEQRAPDAPKKKAPDRGDR